MSSLVNNCAVAKENHKNPSFVASLLLHLKRFVGFLGPRGSESTKGDTHVPGVAPCARFGRSGAYLIDDERELAVTSI